MTNDGKTFAVAGADGVLKVFPLGEEKGAIELKGPAGAVLGAALSVTEPTGVGGAVTHARLLEEGGRRGLAAPPG